MSDRPSASTSAPDYVNILLHGLFFMDFQTDSLVVSTPDVMGHMVMVGCKGLISDLTHDVDWSDPQGPLVPGTATSFAGIPQIPQFSKNVVGHLTGPYKARIALPFPDKSNIIPLRLGRLSDFKYRNVGSGGIGDQIIAHCGANGNKDLALITCLRYERNAPPTGQTLTYSFYA
jgi:hypothetical protein